MNVDTPSLRKKHLVFLSEVLSLAAKSAAPATWLTLS